MMAITLKTVALMNQKMIVTMMMTTMVQMKAAEGQEDGTVVDDDRI